MRWFGIKRAAAKVTQHETAVLDLKQRGDRDGAEALARDWVNREPDRAKAWQLLAEILMWRRKDAEACPAFETALRLDKTHTHTARRFVLVLERLGETRRVEDFLRQVSGEYFSGAGSEKAGDRSSHVDAPRLEASPKALRRVLRRQDYRAAKTLIETLSKTPDTEPETWRHLAIGEASLAHPNEACFWASRAMQATDRQEVREEMAALLSHHQALAERWGGESADGKIEERKRALVENPANVDLPLVLISQVQRSGGSLLAQLFDSHPELYAHPYEFKVGFPTKEFWPRIPADADVEVVRRWMTSSWIRRASLFGYNKASRKDLDNSAIPFCFANDTFVELLERRLGHASSGMDTRQSLNAYFSALFSAWLREEGVAPAEKRCVTAFVPRLSSRPAEVSKFLEYYPDGRLIVIVRDPRAWYASARRHHRGYADLDTGLETWLQSATAIPRLKKRYQDRVIALSYEGLVGNSEATMRRLCNALELSFHPLLLEPTIGAQPAVADSSYHDAIMAKVHTASLTRYRTELTTEAIKHIERVCWEAYQEAEQWTI